MHSRVTVSREDIIVMCNYIIIPHPIKQQTSRFTVGYTAGYQQVTVTMIAKISNILDQLYALMEMSSVILALFNNITVKCEEHFYKH